MNTGLQSRVYMGSVRHRRFEPVSHAFRYRICLLYLDLSELPGLFDPYVFWSARRPAPAWFRRSDYHGPSSRPLAECVRETVSQHLGFFPSGPIRLLTHLRYAGVCFNPVSLYYCYDDRGEQLEAILAEVSNTPWHERHPYVLNCRDQADRDGNLYRFEFPKQFHVSPFMPMDVMYDWRCQAPSDRITVHIRDIIEGRKAFDATLDVKAYPISHGSLARVLLLYPLMTIKVIGAIHWQAMKLYLKHVPFHAHPRHEPTGNASS